MQAILCFLLPPVLMVLLWNKLRGNERDIWRDLARYAISTLLLNGLCLVASTVLTGNDVGLAYRLNTYVGFAVKYLALAVCLAALLPLAVNYCQKSCAFQLELPERKTFQHWRLIGIAYAVVLFLMSAVLIANNQFWGDECFSIRLSKQSFAQMLESTAVDVHPPLYYAILQAVCLVLGHNPVAYNLSALIPYGIMLAFAVTVIWNRFGKESALLYMTLASLLTNAIRYNAEVRMYSWGALFVLLSFYYLYRILQTNKTGHYALFVLFSLCAAYTHYYCLVSVAFFYVVLLLRLFADWKKYLTKVLVSCAATVVLYLPWLMVLLKTFKTTSEGFWLTEIPTVEQSLHFLFQSENSSALVWAFFLLGAAFLLKELGILTVTKEEDKKWKFHMKLCKLTVSADAVWIFGGLLAVFGTILAGIAVSKLFTPMYIVRYLFPVASVAWLVLSVCASRLKGKQLLCLILALVVLVPGLPTYTETMKKEIKDLERLEMTLDATQDVIQTTDHIYTNLEHIQWTIAEYYYPGVYCELNKLETWPEFDPNTTSWLILTSALSASEMEAVEQQGFDWEMVVYYGVLGTHEVCVYKISQGEGV